MPPAGKFVRCTACNEGKTLIDQNQKRRDCLITKYIDAYKLLQLIKILVCYNIYAPQLPTLV